jgi:hypothetical protein
MIVPSPKTVPLAPGAVADANAMSMRLGRRRPLIWQRLVHPFVGDAVMANRKIVIAEYANASVPAVNRAGFAGGCLV